MNDARRTGLTRRDALALGALTGAAGLVRGGAGPAAALAAPRSLAVTVAPDAFTRRGRTEPLHAPGRFVLLGVRDPTVLGADLQVRTRRTGGTWTAWHALHAHVAHGPDRPGRGAGATDPLWTGSSDELQLRASRRPRGPVHVALVAVPRAALALASVRAQEPPQAEAAQLAGRPPIVLRAAWGGDLVPPRTRPAYGQVNLAVVHHTESANEYTQAQAPGVVLAITKFHRDTRGWNDVGYNYLVDRFGTIYEGRAGGVELPVIGAHAQGFNGVSTGISVIGSFTASEPPDSGRRRGRAPDRLAPAARGHPRQRAGDRAVRRRLAREVPRRCGRHAAADLRPPRRRQHRLSRATVSTPTSATSARGPVPAPGRPWCGRR